MKRSAVILGVWIALFALKPASATTVIVDDERATVTQPVTVIDPVGSQTVVVEKDATVVTEVQDPRVLEGEIIRVDYPASTIVVRDIDGRERRVLLKQGMINNYKVDDYVVIRLRTDLREALEIMTRHAADIEGEIVEIDRPLGRLLVRYRDGSVRTFIARPSMIGNYKTGDTVRLYVVYDDPNYQEAKIIRVR